jgi:F0F1-type ATP synthase membrane subunit b/b'
VAFKTKVIKKNAVKMANQALKKGRRAVSDAVAATADYAAPRIKKLQKAARPKIKQLKKSAEPKIKQLKKSAEPHVKRMKKAASKALASGMKGARGMVRNALTASSKKLKKAAKSI